MSVSVLGGIILRRYDQTSTFPGPAVDCLHNVYKLLGVLHGPVDLVVVSGAQINHDVFVAVEEHAGARVVQLVHLVELWCLRGGRW